MTAPLRVLHVSPSAELGGAQAVILECLAAARSWPQVESSVLAFGRGPLLTAVEHSGVSVSFVDLPDRLAAAGESFASGPRLAGQLLLGSANLPGLFRRFARAVKAVDPDVVHTHGIKAHLLAALLPSRVTLVWHLHDYLSSRPFSSRLLRLLSKRCAAAIAVSDSIADDARHWLPAGVHVFTVHNSVDCDRFRPEGSPFELDALAGLPPAPHGTVRIGLAATFARWKGHELFLDAIARLRRNDVRAYIIGGSVYQTDRSQMTLAELRESIDARGLTAQVALTGFVRDMPEAYRALDIVVHASTRQEPFGLVIAEAMACGRAVVSAASGGASELFVDGDHAIAVSPGDAGNLAAALDRLVADREWRAALGRRARAHAVERFGREAFARGISDVYVAVHRPGLEESRHQRPEESRHQPAGLSESRPTHTSRTPGLEESRHPRLEESPPLRRTGERVAEG